MPQGSTKGKLQMVWNLPNIFTLFRFALVAVFVLLFLVFDQSIPALIVFLVAGLTDLIDGYIARKYHMITDWGKVMDPLADKLMQVAVWICLLLAGFVEWWLLAVVAVKEGLLILGGAVGLKRKNLVQPSRLFGKVAAFVMFVALSLSFFHPQIQPVDFYFRLVAVALNLLAFVLYAITFLKMWRESRLTRNQSGL